jgi:hypothetical protein
MTDPPLVIQCGPQLYIWPNTVRENSVTLGAYARYRAREKVIPRENENRNYSERL